MVLVKHWQGLSSWSIARQRQVLVGTGPAHPAVLQGTSARCHFVFFHQGFSLYFEQRSPEEVGKRRPLKTAGPGGLPPVLPCGMGLLWSPQVPCQEGSLSSQILGQTWTQGCCSPFLLFKQQPHAEIAPIKSRRCFPKQRDKNPF